MSTPTNPPAKPAAKPAPTAPTVEDATAIAQAGGTAVENSATPEEAQAASAAAMRAEADARNVTISDEQIALIGSTVITQLEARGAFEPAPPPPTTESPADTTNPPEPTPTPEPPKKKTFAERFMGR